jgi:hypothetical protein
MPGKARPFSRQSQQNQQGPSRVGVSTMDQASIDKYRASGAKVEVLWTPNPKQAIAIARKEREIAFCGARYGGKSSAGTLWMVMGNDGQPLWNEDGSPNLVNISYVHHPQFLGAVVRANEKDLSDWVQKALPYYTAINGVFTKNPAEFTFPSGARVFLGHAKDSDAWTKYQGQNIVRFYIDEAGLIPGADTFDLLLASCRSIYPEMRAQMFLTANPGGPGQRFIFDRYIEPKDRYGKAIKHPTEDRPIRMEDGGLITIEEKVPHPFKHGEELTTTRVWVPSYMTDNSYAMNDPSYIASLATMRDEKMRKAMLFGDWRALSGVYFDLFGKQHLFEPKERTMAGWWKASGSLDWGFVHKSAALKHKLDPNTRQHLIYEEYSVSGADPVELGAQLARWWEPELRIQGSVTIHTAHDCFSNKIGDFTWADLLAKGVNRVLGRDQCYLPDLLVKKIEEERALAGRPSLSDDDKERILTKPVTGIIFRRAPRATAVVWMHIRSLMSLESRFLHKPDPGTPDFLLAQSILEHGTVTDYLAYLKSFQREKEWLPELLVSTACKNLIAAIPKAIHDEDNPDTIDPKHFEGRDEIDSLAYLLSSVRDEKPTSLPPELEKQKAMEEALARNPNLSYQSKMFLAMQVEEQIAEREQGYAGGFTMARNSRRLRAEAAAESRRSAGIQNLNEWDFERIQ